MFTVGESRTNDYFGRNEIRLAFFFDTGSRKRGAGHSNGPDSQGKLGAGSERASLIMDHAGERTGPTRERKPACTTS